MTAYEQRTVEQIQTLYPHLTFKERYDWVKRLEPLFGNDFVKTVEVLSVRCHGGEFPQDKEHVDE